MLEETVDVMDRAASDRTEHSDRSLAVLNAISDPIRWAVLEHLRTRCRCVCDLQETIAVAPNLLSYHLRVLREAGLVTATRRGRWVDYALAETAQETMIAALPGMPPSGAERTRPGCAAGRTADRGAFAEEFS